MGEPEDLTFLELECLHDAATDLMSDALYDGSEGAIKALAARCGDEQIAIIRAGVERLHSVLVNPVEDGETDDH